MIARKIQNIIEISFKYDPALVSFVKSLEGRQYDPQRKVWFIPLAGSQPLIERLYKRGFTIHPELLKAVKQDQEVAREAEALAVLDNADIDINLPLYNFQKVCVAFMIKTGACLNACGVGTGKTIMNLGAVVKNGTKKNLVVAPKSLLLQWQAECNRFVPEYKTFVVSGNKKQREEIYNQVKECQDFYFLIVSYEQVRIDKELLKMF